MNSIFENIYYDVMSSDRMYFKVLQTREVEYNFKITPEVINNFNRWKSDILETTDSLPTDIEILEYFKGLGLYSVGPEGYPVDEKVIEIKTIDSDEFNLRS